MTPLYCAALEIQSFCDRHRWRHCLIGGMALQRWGEPRTTSDVDVSLFTGFEKEESFIDVLLEGFTTRRPDAKPFALLNRVLLLNASNGVAIDIGLAAWKYESRLIRRATFFEYEPDCRLLTASADDLVITKAFADRPKDWVDIENILVCQNDALDWKMIVKELTDLCKSTERPEIVDRLKELRRKVESED